MAAGCGDFGTVCGWGEHPKNDFLPGLRAATFLPGRVSGRLGLAVSALYCMRLPMRVNLMARHRSAAVPAASEGARLECRARIRVTSRWRIPDNTGGTPVFHDSRDGQAHLFQVRTSLDGTTWTTFFDMSDNTKAFGKEGANYTGQLTAVRYLRVVITKNSANEGKHLVEVMAK